MLARMDTLAIASEVLDAAANRRTLAPISARVPGFDVAAAYRVASEVRARRVAAGERPVGRKIGFTNRTIWAEYGVWAPIWGSMYDRTVHDLAAHRPGGEPFPVAQFAEPRLEPEIVFGLGAAPAAGMDDAALFACIDWVAHGFEIVQSVFLAWRFAAADTIAAFGLHGALLVGPRHDVRATRDAWRARLAAFEIELLRNGEVQDRGRAANVLDGPLQALRHLVDVLAADPAQPPLAAGEVVTTGTLTRALPIAPGQAWSTRLHGFDDTCPLRGIEVRFG
jgi:2-oxo-3-hexenedioate decarboxylase